LNFYSLAAWRLRCKILFELDQTRKTLLNVRKFVDIRFVLKYGYVPGCPAVKALLHKKCISYVITLALTWDRSVTMTTRAKTMRAETTEHKCR